MRIYLELKKAHDSSAHQKNNTILLNNIYFKKYMLDFEPHRTISVW